MGEQMIDFLSEPALLPFVAALLLMLLIGIVEALGLGIGHGDLDADLNADGSHLLGWLGVGQVPLLILLVVLLATFSLAGLLIQQLFGPLDLLIAVPAALLAALPLTGILSRGLARILPQDETTAVSIDSLVGRKGVIAIGTAGRGCPAQARVRDIHGQTHHVMVEPFADDARLVEGETVLLVGREGHLFTAMGEGVPLSPLQPNATSQGLLR